MYLSRQEKCNYHILQNQLYISIDDPNKNPNAKKFDRLAYIEGLQRGLQVMDSTATSLCMDNNIPIVVFNIDEHENLVRAARGEDIGTTVGGKRE